MTMQVSGTSGFTFPDNTTQATAASGFGFKNRIINGAMMIDQRNAGASVTPSTTGAYVVDRFYMAFSQGSKFSVQQNAGSVTPPTGFTKYLGLTVASAVSIGASDFFLLAQAIEGQNIADLGWGTANAQAVTLSFRVYSSLTGTFGGSLRNNAANRFYPFSYTISSANTWTTVSITIAGDTSGTWTTDNNVGIQVYWGLGVGSSLSGTAGTWASSGYAPTGAQSVVGTNGATFYITGVQLEKGSTATSFDYRPYGTELALCQRYYTQFSNVSTDSLSQTGTCPNTTSGYCGVAFPIQMRSVPTFSYTSLSNIQAYTFGGSNGTISTLALNAANPSGAMMLANFSNTVSSGVGFYLRGTGASSSIQFSAEL